MASRNSLRASDADRDAVARRLRTAAVEGRLDTEELDHRVGAALTARTYGELDVLLADLPSGRRRASRSRTGVLPVLQTTAAVAVPIIVTALVVAAVIAVIAVAAAWWALWAVMWFLLCGRRGCAMRLPRGRAPAGRGRAMRPASPASLRW